MAGRAGALGPRGLVVAALVAVWAVRLGSFLVRRIRRDGKDGRFDALKTHPGRFLVPWSLQGLWVTLTLAAALVAFSALGIALERRPEPAGAPPDPLVAARAFSDAVRDLCSRVGPAMVAIEVLEPSSWGGRRMRVVRRASLRNGDIIQLGEAILRLDC